MLLKPNACQGCPFYGDGKGFVPDKLNPQAKVFIYAQNPGADEEAGHRWTGSGYEPVSPEPLIGRTGYAMHPYLTLAGLTREEVSLGNAIRCRYKHSNTLPPITSKIVRQAIFYCHNAHFKLPEGTKLIVAQGEYSLFALTKERGPGRGISDWRGYLLPLDPIGSPRKTLMDTYVPLTTEVSVFATLHLAYLFKDPSASLCAKSDWRKISHILTGKWPNKPPKISTDLLDYWPEISAFDTEFIPETGELVRYSVANYEKVVVREAGGFFPDFSIRPTIITHNALADVGYFESISGLSMPQYGIEDTMYLHAVLWPGLSHSLNTLGSLYSSINRWKHLDRLNPVLYSGLDAFGTWEAWDRMKKELILDPGSEYIYKEIQLKLLPIIRKAQRHGIKVSPKALDIKKQTAERLDNLNTKAQALAGWPINIKSNQQTANQLYEVEGL